MYLPSLQGTSAQGGERPELAGLRLPGGHAPPSQGRDGRKDQLQGEGKNHSPQGCLGGGGSVLTSRAPPPPPSPPQE